MSDADLDLFLQYAPLSPATYLRIGGGDPLVHPKFREYMTPILELIDKPLELATNGLWLPKYQDMIPLFKVVHITDYGDRNAWVLRRYGNLPNVNVIVWVNGFYDRNVNPNWTYEEAADVYNHCCRSMAVVCSDRVYGCGEAESLTRHLGLDPELSSVKLGPLWMKDFEAKNMIEVCRHCFFNDRMKRSVKGY